MKRPRVRVRKLTCKRCDHSWVPRQKDPRQCPKCKSAYWDQVRTQREK